jgi:hypothetical protein
MFTKTIIASALFASFALPSLNTFAINEIQSPLIKKQGLKNIDLSKVKFKLDCSGEASLMLSTSDSQYSGIAESFLGKSVTCKKVKPVLYISSEIDYEMLKEFGYEKAYQNPKNVKLTFNESVLYDESFSTPAGDYFKFKTVDLDPVDISSGGKFNMSTTFESGKNTQSEKEILYTNNPNCLPEGSDLEDCTKTYLEQFKPTQADWALVKKYLNQILESCDNETIKAEREKTFNLFFGFAEGVQEWINENPNGFGAKPAEEKKALKLESAN